MMEEIKACPYCGGEVVNSEWNIGSVGWLECDNCGATGPRANNIADAILLWNAAANALAQKDAEIALFEKTNDDNYALLMQMKEERDELKAALADTEEQRHETVSKLSLALIREAADNKRQDELEAEIEKLRESMEFFSENASNYLAERDEARKVARRLYATNKEMIDTIAWHRKRNPHYTIRTEPQTIRVETTASDDN